MKHLFILLTIVLIATSCTSQTTYNNERLKKQNLKINQFQATNTKKPLLIGDVLKHIQVKPISFSFIDTHPDTNMVNRIIIQFYNSKDLNFIFENKLNVYNIILVLKKEIKRSEGAQVFLDNKKVWNTNVYNYLKDLEITEIVTNDK